MKFEQDLTQGTVCPYIRGAVVLNESANARLCMLYCRLNY